MKFRVERDVLAEAVAWAARSLPSRPPVPVLAGVLVEAGDGRPHAVELRLRGLGRAAPPRRSSSEQGSVLVSGRLLAEIARSLPARPVERGHREGGHKVAVTCGSARFTLPTMPVEDYPTLPDLPAAAGTVDRRRVRRRRGAGRLAAGRDDTLPVLTGVRIEIDGRRP